MAVEYPYGYGEGTKTMAVLRARYEPKMHPEYARRLFAWIESLGGRVGVGGGWRKTPSDTSQASRDGKSFHQDQWFRSGLVAYCAVDCVAADGSDADANHDGMTAELAATAVPFGLHANIGRPGESRYESWHIQPIEIDGWQSWVNAGRTDPNPDFVLPGDESPEEPTMRLFKFDDKPPLFASGDGVTAIWVAKDQWPAMVLSASLIETVDRSEAIRYTFVGGNPPPGYTGIWANSGRS
mgnify:FL=1|jgi:hypothetical protein|tara:strand:+ start:8488 stop:9204 length:717 start_codon:yes stop_codon:yes gene_type:complete